MSDDTVKLDHPFVHNGQEIDQLTFKNCKVKDRLALAEILDDIDDGANVLFNTKFDIKAVAYMSGKDVSVVENIDERDWGNVKSTARLFMPKGWESYITPSTEQSAG